MVNTPFIQKISSRPISDTYAQFNLTEHQCFAVEYSSAIAAFLEDIWVIGYGLLETLSLYDDIFELIWKQQTSVLVKFMSLNVH